MLKVFPHTIDIEEILYIVSIKCMGDTAQIYKIKIIFYLTEIIFLSIYVNHSSVTFLGVNFFLIEDPGKRILCVHRAESKNLCTVIISGFNVEAL